MCGKRGDTDPDFGNMVMMRVMNAVGQSDSGGVGGAHKDGQQQGPLCLQKNNLAHHKQD